MVTLTKVVLVDDIDGTEATRTVRLSVDGRRYELDLNDTHYRELSEALEPYLKAARRQPGGATRGRKPKAA